MTRIFIYQGVEYDDPGEQYSNEQVLENLASVFPALAKGKIEVKNEDGVTRVTFTDAPKKNG